MGELVLVEELIVGQSLVRFIRRPPGDPPEMVRHRILCDICAAVNYLHHSTPAIVHGDLTPANVLIETLTLRPKLIDFGLSRRYGKEERMTGGTKGWMAPEILAGQKDSGSRNLLAASSADI